MGYLVKPQILLTNCYHSLTAKISIFKSTRQMNEIKEDR